MARRPILISLAALAGVSLAFLSTSVKSTPPEAPPPRPGVVDVKVTMRLIGVSRSTWEALPEFGVGFVADFQPSQFATQQCGAGERTLAIMDDRQVFQFLVRLQGDLRTWTLFKQELTIREGQQATARVECSPELHRGAITGWFERLPPIERVRDHGIAGMQVTLLPRLGQEEYSLALQARLMKGPEPYEAITTASQPAPKHTPFVADAVDAPLELPIGSSVLLGGWKVQRYVNPDPPESLFAKAYRAIKPPARQVENDLLILLVGARQVSANENDPDSNP